MLWQVHIWALNGSLSDHTCTGLPLAWGWGDKIHLSIWPGFMGTQGTAKHKVIPLLLGTHGRNARAGARSG